MTFPPCLNGCRLWLGYSLVLLDQGLFVSIHPQFCPFTLEAHVSPAAPSISPPPRCGVCVFGHRLVPSRLRLVWCSCNFFTGEQQVPLPELLPSVGGCMVIFIQERTEFGVFQEYFQYPLPPKEAMAYESTHVYLETILYMCIRYGHSNI